MSDGVDAVGVWLREWVAACGGIAGTVHVRRGEELVLAAAVNIPASVVEVVGVVPRGKGMAGLAFERGVLVSTCDLKTDVSGDVRPGARAVDANAAVAIPVCDAVGEVRGVVGIAYLGERVMGESELAVLMKGAQGVPLMY